MAWSGRLLSAGILLAALGGGTAGAATISISCGAVGLELKVCQDGAQAWAQETGNQVNVISTPNSATERLALYQQILAANSADIDVFQIDVIWPGILANHLLDLTEYIPEEQVEQNFDTMIENNTVDGAFLVAMPWFTDAGLLYYRKDLLEAAGKQPPATWAELRETAKAIQEQERANGNAQMWGYVYQGKAYEGLTCNALEWIDSFGGGTIVNDEGEITVDNPQAAEALAWAASTVGTIAPEGVLNYSEEESRGVFQSGNAVFMRNWPYAWALSQAEDSPIKGKVGVAILPKGGPNGEHTGALGGWQLAVSKYSNNAEIAADLVRYLTSAEEQKRRAIVGAYNPTIESLYQDQEILAAVPFFGPLFEVFTNAVARPSKITGNKYNQASSEFFNAVHEILSGRAEPAPRLAELAERLDRISRGGRW
jgi:trehalose/maltose transport system substrate-binding protein